MADPGQYLNPNYSKKNLGAIQVSQLFNEIKTGNVAALSKGITLLESELEEHKTKAAELLKLCLPLSGNSIRIGITGIPGAGKSTFIESIGQKIISDQYKLAVLAIDPSSTLTKGSILGDKTRMEELSRMKNVFIRPTPTSGNLGGVARATKESMILCEAAGFDVIMVETVGVGQSEIELHYLTDIFLLLLIPGAGDELQGIKRGIMEMADLILVNKAEGNNIDTAKQAVKHLENAVHYLQKNKYGRTISVHSISALENIRVNEIWEQIQSNIHSWKSEKTFDEKRKDQAIYWYDQSLNNGLKNIISQRKDWLTHYETLKTSVESGKLHPFSAADEMLKKIVEK
jgi:LAO/AO transport system kinase